MNMKDNETKRYFIPNGSVNPKDLICENFFDAVDTAVKQILKKQGLDYKTLDLNKLNVCITKAYVMKHNSMRICKLLWASENLYHCKFYRTIIVNVED